MVAGRSPRRGGSERSERWKGEVSSPLQGDLALVGNMGSDPGDELQVIHPLNLFMAFHIPVEDFPLQFIKGETFPREERPDHVFAHPLGLLAGFRPDLTVDRKTCMPLAYDLLH
ncbi:MAG: hypothetical protein APZ16_06965 [Candidatus Hadarchaeum yellowstonense]|uniref:Uncharacterized protein n=1 Tax=Hadarchaeum yellowstonense TaxID=1776334 RepID=A0A147K0A3_HADYE|nr:MAG: hypothetical protein APZ16_06965 [Candidatus Hadarchaeum yellowstonense]